MRLPKRLLVIKNADKEFHENWKKNDDELNFPHPFRGVLIAQPNKGKSLVIKNILLRQSPEFEKIIVIHCSPDYTKEYDDIDCDLRSDIPPPEDFDGEDKTLVILDDLAYKKMRYEQATNLDRLFGFVSTHCNVSILLASQDAFNILPTVRRMANLWIIWKQDDMDSLKMLARKVGMRQRDFVSIMENLLKNEHDSLWIDKTKKTPYPLRLNGYKQIKRHIERSPLRKSTSPQFRQRVL